MLVSRIVVGWDLSDFLERHSMIRAFNKAHWRKRPGQGLLIQSERGVHYASADFRKLLKRNTLLRSMSRKGNCWDNAVTESFFHTPKTQLIYLRKFQDQGEAEKALFNYIKIYYNRRRRHSSIGYQSPAMFESNWVKIENAA